MNTVTPVGIAIAVAVVIALAFLFLGPDIFAPFPSAQPQAALTNGTATNAMASTTPETDTNAAPTSLQVTDLSVGTGTEAVAGDTVTVDYVGALTDGTVFDASKNHGQPFSFTLGAGQVIPGWDQGVPGMKVGGQRVLVIPASLGYGPQTVGTIPANSTLIFEITLLGVQKGK